MKIKNFKFLVNFLKKSSLKKLKKKNENYFLKNNYKISAYKFY